MISKRPWSRVRTTTGCTMPCWRIEALGGEAALPATVVRHVHDEQARAAIAHLEKAFAHHPDHPLLHIEIANLLLQKPRSTLIKEKMHSSLSHLTDWPRNSVLPVSRMVP